MSNRVKFITFFLILGLLPTIIILLTEGIYNILVIYFHLDIPLAQKVETIVYISLPIIAALFLGPVIAGSIFKSSAIKKWLLGIFLSVILSGILLYITFGASLSKGSLF